MKQTFKSEKGHLIATLSFDRQEIAKANEKAINKLVLDVTVPGFRKGKAPKEKAIGYISQQKLFDGTVNSLLHMVDKNLETIDEFQAFVKEGKLAQRHPDVNLTKFTNDEAEFIITWVLLPVVSKLGNYKGLKTSVKAKAVTDADVSAEIKHLAEENAELVESEKEAQMGDTVNIDFVGLMNGEAFEGGSAKAFDLELGSHRFVPGFEEQLVSHKAGDKVDVAVTLPDNYPEPLKSKDVIFKVTVNSVKVKEVPEINDEFATTLSGKFVAKDLAELNEKVKADLEEQSRKDFTNELLNDLLLQIRDASEFEIASEIIDDEGKHKQADDEAQIARQGLDLEEYLELIKLPREEYDAQNRAGVENQIKSQLIHNKIAEVEKVPAPTKEELEKALGSSIADFQKNYGDYLSSQGLSQEEVGQRVNAYLNSVFNSLFTGKVHSTLLELNGAKKKPAAKKKAAEKPADKTPVEEKPAEEKPAEEKAE